MRLTACLLLVALLPALAQDAALPDTNQLERELKRFMEVYAIASQDGADAAPPDASIYGGAIPGMLRILDPHSVFFDKNQFQQLQEMEKSVTKGFGSVVSVLPGRVIVLQALAGTPSQKAGLAPGDEIVAINNIPLARLDLDQLIQLLSYARQQQAHLMVRRQGTAKLLSFTLTPEELQSPSVDRAFLLEPGTGYVRVTSFDSNTAQKAREAIESLGGEKLERLVLDLRGNPGGVLNAGLSTAAMFLPPGTRILSARGRRTEREDIEVPKDAKPYGFQLAVLVDGKTGSAAEVVAGAIQDNDRGLIAGETTFGKGLVQRVYSLSDSTGLALTTAFYYTPSGRSIQKPLPGSELDAAIRAGGRPEVKTAKGRTVRGGGGIEPDLVVPPDPVSRFREVTESSAAFANFATEWLSSHRADASVEMEITPAMLDEFQLYLSRRNIRPAMGEWIAERRYLSRRLKQEILNQSISVAAGDEIEVKNDPQVLRALEAMRESSAK
jgi:carboxyl-terminal processing protease